MKIGISGHRGLIGSFLMERLKREGHEIVLAVDLVEGKDVNELKDMKMSGIGMFIHCAAFCKINKTVENPEKGFENAQDCFTVFEFCRKNDIKKIVYFSSSRVLNNERNPYTAGKIFGEELCKAYKDCYGIEYLVIRPSTVYGPVVDRTNRLMNIFITNALNNEDLKIYGDPETKTLDFTYVDDFVYGVMLALNGGWNKSYNISGNSEIRILDLARFIIKETNSLSRIIVGNSEIAQPQNVKVDISEIKKLGYNPKIEIWEGVRRNIDFLRKQTKKFPKES